MLPSALRQSMGLCAMVLYRACARASLGYPAFHEARTPLLRVLFLNLNLHQVVGLIILGA